MTRRLPPFRITAMALLLTMGVIVAVWLLVLPGGKTTPAIAAAVAVQRACDAMTVQHHDASIAITNTENRITQTLTVAGNDSRLVAHLYHRTGDTLIAKIEAVWKDGIHYWRESPDGSPNTWGAWEIVEDSWETFRLPTPCLNPVGASSLSEGASGTSQERHFVLKTEDLGDTVETEEFWVGTDGVPVRALFTLTEATAVGASGASGQSTTHANKILRTIAIDYSGFGQTNTITAPIDPPKPGAPRDFTATAGDGQVTLDFYNPPNTKPAITGYEYRQRVGSGPWGSATTMPSSFIVTGLNNGTQYGFQVRVINSSGESDWSAEATATPASATPIFGEESYALSIGEHAELSASVGTVSATDADNDTLTYSITAGNGDGKFAIGSATGAITVAGSLDHEDTASYTLTVEASDGTGADANKTTVQVVITVEDENDAPVFDEESYAFSTGEHAELAAAVGTISATDADNDTLAYAITTGNGDGKFAIGSATGAIAVAGALDFEDTASYTLTVEVSDGTGADANKATAQVEITVTDEKDAPVFDEESYSFSIAENIGNFVYIGDLDATDQDGDAVNYSLRGAGANRFVIDLNIGDIFTAISGSFDYETKSSYTLTADAKDGKGGIGSVTVEITVTDVAESPPPTPDGLAVSLADGVFTATWNAVTDASKYRIQYRTGGSEETWTNLAATDSTSQTLNATECGATYEFRVEARGDGTVYTTAWSSPSSSVSQTATGCHAPVFSSETYSFSVAENAAVGAAVGTAGATDADGDSLSYAITAGNGDGKFSIGTGGAITVAAALDYETTVAYSLTVEATDDSGRSDTATVSVAVTDVSETGPPAPSGLAVSYTSGAFGLTWDAVTGADQYRVQHRKGDGPWTNLSPGTGTSQSFTPAGGAKCATTYEFRLQAHGDGTTYSAVWGARTNGVTYNTGTCPAPGKPGDPSATATADSVTLSWGAPSNSTVTGYQILRRASGTETGLSVLIEDTGSTATTYTDMAVTANTSYVYRVKASNSGSLSPQSKPVSVRTPRQ